MKQESGGCGEYMTGMPKSIQERVWIDVTASSEEECTVQVELWRKSLHSGKVCQLICVEGSMT